MRLSRQIARQPVMRLAAAVIFLGVGIGALAAAYVLGEWGLLWVAGMGAGTGVLIACTPTDRIDDRWFHLLPLFIGVETVAGSIALAPDGAAVIGLFAFLGPTVGFLIEKPREVIAHLVFATALLAVSLVVVETTTVTRIATLCMLPLTWGLGGFVMLVWQRAEATATELEHLTLRDPLTGVGNRRHLAERLEYELARHERMRRECALIVLDLNGFKQVNDERGHAAGDVILGEAAAALKGAVRRQDTLARQGGDEFCVLAPECGPLQAERVIQHLRAALARVDCGGHPLTAAFGAAVYPRDAADADGLAALADERERRDKRRYAASRDAVA